MLRRIKFGQHEGGPFCPCCDDPTKLKALTADVASWLSGKLQPPQPVAPVMACPPCKPPDDVSGGERLATRKQLERPTRMAAPAEGRGLYWILASCGLLLGTAAAAYWRVLLRACVRPHLPRAR